MCFKLHIIQSVFVTAFGLHSLNYKERFSTQNDFLFIFSHLIRNQSFKRFFAPNWITDSGRKSVTLSDINLFHDHADGNASSLR